jgi:hypothetical protein
MAAHLYCRTAHLATASGSGPAVGTSTVEATPLDEASYLTKGLAGVASLHRPLVPDSLRRSR